MHESLIDPTESLERQNQRLLAINAALMRRIEQGIDGDGAAYAMFERAVVLEDQVRQRTLDLEQMLELLNSSNAQLAETNAELKSAREDLSNAIEAIEEGFALFSPDDRLVLANSRFAQQLIGVRSGLRPGITFHDYVQSVSLSDSLSLPEDTTASDWANQRLQRHGEAHVAFNVQLRGDQWLQVSEHRTPTGGTVIVQTDITDVVRLGREERERLIDDQARMVRATLDHLAQGVAIFDHRALLVGWNERFSAMVGFGAGALRIGLKFDRVATRIRDRFEVSDLARLEMLEHSSKGVLAAGPISFELSEPTGVILDTFARQMPDQGFVISLTDVTAERHATRVLAEANELLERGVAERTNELEAALRAARRANSSKTRFVAAASHDLLQPLSAAKLYIASATGTEHAPLLEKAERALVSAEMIIEALLDISKLDSGEAQFQIGPVPLMDVLRPLRDQFQPMAALKGLDLRIVETESIVLSDPAYLRRILQNLIGNAVRYTQTGKILVGPRRIGDSLRLEVWDTGPGIPEEHHGVIFEEFSRLNARASAGEGLGLGLAIVERACARLGHPLSLWSVPGRGSGFFINLSRADVAEPSAPAEARRRRQHDLRGMGMIVLLVENDADLRRAISSLLDKWDVSVLDVASGHEAESLLAEIGITPDAFLIDYQLDDGESGLDLAERLFLTHGRVPTCVLSANRSPELRHACACAELPLLNKPLDADQLSRFLYNSLVDEKAFLPAYDQGSI